MVVSFGVLIGKRRWKLVLNMLTGSSLSSLLVCPAPERSHKGHWQAQFGVALLVVPSELGEGRASSLLKPCIRKTYMIFFFLGLFHFEPLCNYLLKR